MKTLAQALSEELSERFFGYRGEKPDPPSGFDEKEWQSLSPGMRREIVRDLKRITDSRK